MERFLAKACGVVMTLCLLSAGSASQSEGFQSYSTRVADSNSGVCCLCVLAFDGNEFSWSCPCSFGQGALGCEVNKAGCTSVGECP